MSYFRSNLKKIYNVTIVRKFVTKLYLLFKKPPYKTLDMELKYGLWCGVSSLHSVDGRQFGENNVEPEILRDTALETKLHLCKFEGSRYGFMMNMTALTIIMQEWEPAVDIITSIRQFYLNKTNQKNKTLTLTECYVVSKMCVAFPVYLVRCKHSGLSDGQLPTIISSQFQLISGVFMIIRKMIEEGESFLSECNIMTAEEIYSYADKHNVFFSEKNKQVCSGSKVKIIELIDFVLNGREIKEGKSNIFYTSLNNNIDDFYAYAMASIELELVTGLSRSVSQQLFSTLASNKLLSINNEVLDELDGYDCQDINYSKKLHYTIQSYFSIINLNLSFDEKQEIVKLITYYEEIFTNNYDDLAVITVKYKKIISLTSDYLIYKMNIINKYLGYKIKIKIKSDDIYNIIGVVSFSLYNKLSDIE